jgi:hypothetical protein
MTPGSAVPEGSRVTPVSAPVELVWQYVVMVERSTTVRAAKIRRQQHRKTE